jgi:hypothetical protein
LVIGSLVLVAGIALFLALGPFLTASALRFWMQRVGRREGFAFTAGKIEAPLFRPVVVNDLHLATTPGAPFRVDCTAGRMVFDLNFRGIFNGTARSLRGFQIEKLVLDIRRDKTASDTKRRIPWSVLKNLLSDNFNFSGVSLHVENGTSIVDLRDAALSGSELEAGMFDARELAISSPFFQRTFSNVRGATSWQNTQLAIGAVSLMRGLDVDTITIDLSQIGASQIGIELGIDAFGGKVRARISSDDRGDKRTWDIAGSGSGVSLAQMSDALEWESRASGSLHASKFTFRGEMSDVRNATASIWAEVSGLTWRDRTADTVMIGASLFNREVQVEQLYIKQRSNELTFNGEFPLPEKATDWLKPAFRGDINASINDLGDFARLFGQSPADFSGKLTAQGKVSANEGKLRGQVTCSGNSLVLFRSGIEFLEMRLGLEEAQLTIANLEVRNGQDFLRAQASVSLTDSRSASGALETSVADIADYRGFIPTAYSSFEPAGKVTADWKAQAGSGTVKIEAQNFRLGNPGTASFDADVDAEYSPATTFFRRFHFWNRRADLKAFVTAARDYFHVQDLRFGLDGQPFLHGNIYLPISTAELRATRSWIGALSADPFFDVDLTLESVDLANFAAAVSAKPVMSGRANGHLQLSGTPGSLQGNADFNASNFVFDASPAVTLDLEIRQALGIANFKANFAAAGSNALAADGAFPFRLEKSDNGYEIKSSGPMTLTAQFPAILLPRLPRYLSPAAFTRGILRGDISVTGSVDAPTIAGEIDLIDGQLLGGWRTSGAVIFKGETATIGVAAFGRTAADMPFHGKIDYRDVSSVDVTVFPESALETNALGTGDCVSSIELGSTSPAQLSTATVRQVKLRGSLFARNWTIALSRETESDQPDDDRWWRRFRFCRDGKPLSLTPSPALFP